MEQCLMPPEAIPRYHPTFRLDEIDLILRFALRGESLGFLGVAGVGKSNLVNFLRDIQKNAPQVKQDVTRLHFPVVDTPQWPGTPNSLWKMMLEALNQVTRELSPPPELKKIIPISEDERAFKALHDRLQWICQDLGHQVMCILDDFDRALEIGPLEMLERLNGLRSEGNRDYLSYLVLTKKLPHVLGQTYDLENKSKFYYLFRNNIYALEPYKRDDALQMLRHLNNNAESPLSDSQLEQIYRLAGGHPGLLRLVFKVWIEDAISSTRTSYLVSKPDIQQECQRVLANLHAHEQNVALRVARGQQTPEDHDVIDHLARRGLLVEAYPPKWFSPLMARFLSTYEL